MMKYNSSVIGHAAAAHGMACAAAVAHGSHHHCRLQGAGHAANRGPLLVIHIFGWLLIRAQCSIPAWLAGTCHCSPVRRQTTLIRLTSRASRLRVLATKWTTPNAQMMRRPAPCCPLPSAQMVCTHRKASIRQPRFIDTTRQSSMLDHDIKQLQQNCTMGHAQARSGHALMFYSVMCSTGVAGVSLCVGDQRRLLTGVNYFGFEVAATS
jgi:hypothetical protein